MIRLNLQELLHAKGRNASWLQHELNMSPKNFDRMLHNETQSIRYENIEKLCAVLNCTPNDLFCMDEEDPRPSK